MFYNFIFEQKVVNSPSSVCRTAAEVECGKSVKTVKITNNVAGSHDGKMAVTMTEILEVMSS